MTRAQGWCLVGCVAAAAASLCALLLEARATVAALPGELQATRAALVKEIQTTRRELLAEVDAQASGIGREAAGQVGALRAETLVRVDAGLGLLDRRTGDALERVDRAAGVLEGLRADLRPALEGAAQLERDAGALVVDARDSWDDLYPDVRGAVASATVAITSVAQASEEVRNAAPQLAASAVGVGQSAAAIAGDVRREVDAITAPKRWWQRILGPVYTAGRIVGTLL